MKKYILPSIWFVYGSALVYILFLHNRFGTFGGTYIEYLKSNSNFIPLRSLFALITAPYKSSFLVFSFFKNLIGNLLIFVPWGILLPLCNRRFQSFKLLFSVTIILLFTVETVQLFTMRGSFDVEDIILNLIGSFCEFLFFRLVFKKRV